MKFAQLLLLLCLLANCATAQNYYVAAVKGAVYYKNKLLIKHDKVAIGNEIRFKSLDSYVKLSGPGGLYTLSASDGKASGNEFLMTLSNELFPPVRMIATVASNFTEEIFPVGYWGFGYTQAPNFLDQTVLPIPHNLVTEGQLIVFIHETDQGLVSRKATIQQDSMLMIHAADFDLSATNTPKTKIKTSVIAYIGSPAILDTLLANHKTVEDLERVLPVYRNYRTHISSLLVFGRSQILDSMGAAKIIDRQQFMSDLRAHIKRCKPKSQAEFLYPYRFESYINRTYGSVYQLRGILREELGLRDNGIIHFDMGYWHFLERRYSFLDKTVLPVSRDLTAAGQMIIFLHETDQGLFYRKADIRNDTNLIIHTADFDLSTSNSTAPEIRNTAIVQIGDPAILAPLLAENKTIDDVRRYLCACYGIAYDAPPKSQILDQLGASRVINRKDFLKDLGFHIKLTEPASQYMFLDSYFFEDYIHETYGDVYQLRKLLAEELNLPDDE